MAIELKSIDQQVIVITGASSGICLATALAAAHQGARVVLGARSGETLDEIAAHISAEGAQAVAVQLDVVNRARVQQLAQRAIDAIGRIDTWVNGAGSPVALPYLRQGGGTPLNIGSEASEAAIPLQAMYSASKHAVKGFTDGLRLALEADDDPVPATPDPADHRRYAVPGARGQLPVRKVQAAVANDRGGRGSRRHP